MVNVLRIPVDIHPGQEKQYLCSCLLIRSKAQCIIQLCRQPDSLEEWAMGPVWVIQKQGFHFWSVPSGWPGLLTESESGVRGALQKPQP